jgi:membrane fusion protein, multidrug efflux system
MMLSVNISKKINFNSMKNNIITQVLILLVFMSSCSLENKETKKTEDVKNAFKLKKQEVSKILNLPAELLPFDRAEINAKVEGYVQKVLVDIGDVVKKGEILVVIEAPELAARYAESIAKCQEAEARFGSSLDKYNRIQVVSKRIGLVAEAEVINTKNEMLADSADLISAKSITRVYKQMQDYLIIRAPFNGIVTDRYINAGDLVGITGKAALLTLVSPDKFRLRVNVPEYYVNSISSDGLLNFTTEAVVGKTFTAKLARKSGNIDRDTRTELWEYEYNNNDKELKPGMYTIARIKMSRTAGSFVVPSTSIVTTLEKKFVIRINQDKVEWVDVTEGISQESGLEIFGNLQEGDILLTRGTDELKQGTTVKIALQDH